MLHNVRLYARVLATLRREERLLTLASSLSSSLETSRVAAVAVSGARRLTGSEEAAVYLVDEAKGQLYSPEGGGGGGMGGNGGVEAGEEGEEGDRGEGGGGGEEGREREEGGEEERVPLNAGVARWAASHCETVNIKNAGEDERCDESGREGCSVLCVPITSRGGGGGAEEVIGVAQLVHRAVGAFGGESERTLEAFAAHAGVALTNARRYQRVCSLHHFLITMQADNPRPFLALLPPLPHSPGSHKRSMAQPFRMRC